MCKISTVQLTCGHLLAGEEKLNRAIDEIRAVEAEKRENALQSERAKVDELDAAMAKLRQVSITRN